MDEVQLKHELAGLEQRILGITGDPLDYQHYRRFLDWSRNEMKVNEIEELMSDRCLILNLLFGCHCTPGEVERLEKVNDLSIEVKLTIQQFSDQERNRLDWCRNYDLRHFKEVLLKEAADRPEGVSLEDALLQRCRDHFEDIADEILDKVGLSDIDLYLETLKNRIDKS